MDLVDLGEVKDKLNLKGISRPAACGLVVVLAIVACVCVFMFAQGQGGALEVASAAAQDAAPEKEAGDAQAAAASQPSIFVHVTGCVNAPGLIELPQKSRVAQAIEAAGGFKDDADTASINLARELSDGEQLYVTSKTEAATDANGAAETASVGASEFAAQGSAGASASAQSGGKVNINKASASELTALPGIGNATAEKIVSDRKANGPFAKVEDLTRVSGIGDKKFEAIRELICV